jgi:hypothetical protein
VLEFLIGIRQPSHQYGCSIGHGHLQCGLAEGIPLETGRQDINEDHEQQPIDPLRVPQTTALELEDASVLIAEQLFTFQYGLCHRQAGGMGFHQVPRQSGCHRPRTGQSGTPGIPHAGDAAPGLSSSEPGDRLITGTSAIQQQRDRLDSGMEWIGLLQHGNRNRGTNAGTGMLQGLPPQQRNGLVVDHPGGNNDAELFLSIRGPYSAWLSMRLVPASVGSAAAS